MPELPEVEITARRLNAALSGASVDSAVAPGMNVMKTFEPPLEALVGREVTGVRRVGKMPVVEFGDLALLIHLMSAGRLQVFDKRASAKDRASRVLIRLEDGRELRLREFGTKQRAWAKLLPADAVAEDEMVATLGPEAWPPPPLEEFAALIDQPRHLHPLLRDQRTIAGIGRSWVDEVLWEARLSPFKKGSELNDEEVERLHGALHVLGDAIEHYEEVVGEQVPDKLPMPLQGPQARGRALPALRHDDRGRLLLRAPDQLLPGRADRRPGAQGPPPLPPPQVAARGFRENRPFGPSALDGSRRRLKSRVGAEWVRAPTEMKSTPVSAIGRTVSRSTPPEASSDGPLAAPRRGVAQLDRLAQRLGVHVVEQQQVGAGPERVGDLVEVAALDLDREVGVGAAGGVDGLGQRRRRGRCGSP